MQHERVRIGAKLGDDERHPLCHQAGDERHVAGQAAQLGHHHRGLAFAGLRQRRGELRPAVQGVGALAGLDLDKLADHLATLGGSEPGNGIALGFDAQAALTLLPVDTRM